MVLFYLLPIRACWVDASYYKESVDCLRWLGMAAYAMRGNEQRRCAD